MHVASPPVRRRSHDAVAGHIPPDDAGHGHALDEPLAWDHFVVEVTDASLPVVVHCRGGLDFAYADQLRDVFAGIAERQVVVDLQRLTFVDSTGLSVLLSARRALLDVGGTMTIRGASGLVRRVFQAAELADVLDD
jgi:anti-anti-sigma factor